MRFLIVTLAVLALLSCGKDESDSSPSITSAADLEGTWESGCVRSYDLYYKFVVTFEGDDRRASQEYYGGDEKCKVGSLRYTYDVEGTYEIVGESELVSGAINVNHEIVSAIFTIKAQSHADYLNEDPPLCNKADWEVDVEYNDLEICDNTTDFYTTYVLKDSKLYAAFDSGDADGKSEEARFTNVRYDTPFVKE